MKTTDNIRRIDDLGRVVLPMGIRKNLNISSRDPLEIYVDCGKILIKKHEAACILCGNLENLTKFRGKTICGVCKSEFTDIQQALT